RYRLQVLCVASSSALTATSGLLQETPRRELTSSRCLRPGRPGLRSMTSIFLPQTTRRVLLPAQIFRLRLDPTATSGMGNHIPAIRWDDWYPPPALSRNGLFPLAPTVLA